MKKIASLLLLATALVTPSVAFAKNVTVTAEVANYRGPGSYLAIYLTKPNGSYASTLWVAGQNREFYRHLRGWVRGISAAGGNIDGITGASVGSGRTLTVNLHLADALIDAGYKIQIDSAVENFGEYTGDAVVPLATSSSGKAVAGKGFVKSLTVQM